MVKIGIIGSGFMARTHAAAYAACPLVAELHLLSTERGVEKARGIAAEHPRLTTITTDAEAFFASDLDGIDICTPTPSHAEFVRRGLKSGKAVLCEKPLTLDVAESHALASEAAAAGGLLMVAQVIRFWPEYAELRARIADGSLGRLRTLRMERYSPLPGWGEWFSDPAASGGTLFDLLIHDVDFLRDALGQPARLTALGEKPAGGAYQDIEALFEFPGGVRASAFSSYAYPAGTPFRMQFRALFERGCLDYDLWRTPQFKLQDAAGEHELAMQGRADGYAAQAAYFAGCIAGGRSPVRASAESAAETIALLHAIARSADAGGRWLDFD